MTSTGEDEREYQSEHETSWDEFDERYDNFTAGRERLQEFNGRIPPRKKKKDVPKQKPEKKVGLRNIFFNLGLKNKMQIRCFKIIKVQKHKNLL